MQGMEPKEVELHGFWASSDCAMVRHALNLKGVAYKYVEAEINVNGTDDLLLRIYEKVPILVVDGQSIAVTAVILEFIEETWKDDPPLLPQDPYSKARVRFWADFFFKKLLPTSFAIMYSEGEAQEKATQDFVEYMVMLEGGVARELASGGPFIHGERPGLLDVIMGSCANGLKALGAVPGVELLDKERMPVLSSAVAAFVGLETATLIPYDELLELHWILRDKGLAMAKAMASSSAA